MIDDNRLRLFEKIVVRDKLESLYIEYRVIFFRFIQNHCQ